MLYTQQYLLIMAYFSHRSQCTCLATSGPTQPPERMTEKENQKRKKKVNNNLYRYISVLSIIVNECKIMWPQIPRMKTWPVSAIGQTDLGHPDLRWRAIGYYFCYHNQKSTVRIQRLQCFRWMYRQLLLQADHWYSLMRRLFWCLLDVRLWNGEELVTPLPRLIQLILSRTSKSEKETASSFAIWSRLNHRATQSSASFEGHSFKDRWHGSNPRW